MTLGTRAGLLTAHIMVSAFALHFLAQYASQKGWFPLLSFAGGILLMAWLIGLHMKSFINYIKNNT
jgi:hypothetical protein